MATLDTKWHQEQKPPASALTRTFDFLDGLTLSGLAVASYRPSAAMIEAGARAGNISVAQAKAAYMAMISHNE